MAAHTSGSGASVSGVSHSAPQGAASKERYVYGILALLEKEENDLIRIADRTDRITITANLSTKTANIDLLLNVAATNAANGSTNYTATHYLTGSTFTSGTGGSSAAPNLAQAAMEAVIGLKLIELDKTRNPDNKNAITRCTHTLATSGGSNATFSALLEFPIEIISLPGGGSVIEGKVYLT
ncbi:MULTISPECIES: hypothetical protein [unclassified Microcoleus]|uniref:hypothetical protein n=1 Tax=unclassified Microcoleus TaxID=2642155 RepID=UPI002FD34D54